MKPKTGREWQAEVAELRKENERLRAELEKLKPATVAQQWPECPWCGNPQKLGHDCRPEK